MPQQLSHTLTSQVPGVGADSFVTAHFQATLFTPEEEVSSAKIANVLLPRWQDRFDGQPFLLPVSAGVPREIPKVILQTSQGDLRCEISSERISMVWQKTNVSSDVPADFLEDAVRRILEYRDFARTRVGRLAAVTTRYAPHVNPGKFLAQHFCQERWLRAPLNRPENFELHAHKTFPMSESFVVNSWVRNKTGIAQVGPVVLVEQDINTLSEEASSRDFSSDEISMFFALVRKEFDKILNLYFPKDTA